MHALPALRTQTLTLLERMFQRFASGIAPPVKVTMLDHFVYRYEVKSIEQALIQKLARVVSGLHAADVLLEHGFLQELGALHRILDEIGEDITFLAVARTNGGMTPMHERYLEAFYGEQMPPDLDVSKPVKGYDSPSRKEIRKYLKRVLMADAPANFADAAIAKAYGGYVHAASQNTMDMYGGDPPRFHLRGMVGTPMQHDHAEGSWNYIYRGLLAFETAAKAFGDAAGLKVLRDYRLEHFAEFAAPSDAPVAG